MFSARSSLYDEKLMDRKKKVDKWNRSRDDRFRRGKDVNPDFRAGKMAKPQLGAGSFFAKAGMAATMGSGVKRETFMNSIGLLTRHQKDAAKAGGMASLNAIMMPALAAVGAISTLSEGGGVKEYVGDWVLPGIGLMTGWNVGKNMGFGIGKTIGGVAGAAGRGAVAATNASKKALFSKARMSGPAQGMGSSASRHRMLLGLGGGRGIAGALAGGALMVGAGEILKQSTDSNSMINQLAEDMTFAAFRSDLDQTQGTLTHRQKTLSKISKSGLNDRGTLMGNEAQIMAGIL